MKKKYYILALAFLCLLVGQQSFGQSSGGDYDYSNIDNFIDEMLAANPDINVNYFYETQSYVDFVNSDGNYSNDFVDVNNDGQINEGDDLYRQNLIIALGMNDSNPVALTDAELQALWQAGVPLNEVVVINNYHNYNSVSIAPLYYINPYDPCIIHPEYCGGGYENNDPPTSTWYRDNDEDGYDSGIRNQEERPTEEGNWIKGTSKGTDCDDRKYNKDNVCYVPLTDTCLKANLDAILNASSSTNVFTKLFNDNFGANLGCVINFIQYSNPNNTNIDAFARQTGSDSFDLRLNLAALDYASDEYIRATIYHEIIHNYLTMFNSGDSNYTEIEQHEEMEKNWRTIIANQLKLDFPNLSDADATGLSWGGLGETAAYQKMLADDLQNNTGITGAIAASNKNFKNLNNTNTTTYGTICN